ncbi:hypothetical protein T484DRAFT_1932909 [Baffinella frigidus]|nr:hypothetical protein T484DRAFT_1932909 [Cryptophyta sp. CCMP2293]
MKAQLDVSAAEKRRSLLLVAIHVVAAPRVEGVPLEAVGAVVAPSPLGACRALKAVLWVLEAVAALGAPDPLVAHRARACEVPALVRGDPRHL